MTVLAARADARKRRRRERELSSEERAGAYSRQEALRRQRRFLRRNWRLLAICAAGLFVIWLPFQFVFFGHDDVRWFFNGVYLTFTIAALWQWVLVASGSASLVMGDLGEQWTRTEMRRLADDGWKVLHHVRLKGHSDIDTIALGPAGLVVIETKWSGESWTTSFNERRLRDAVDYVASIAKTTHLFVHTRTGELPVHPAVVVWPDTDEISLAHRGNVAVMPGMALREWIRSLTPAGLSTEQIEAGWDKLDEHIAKRDAWDLEQNGPPLRTTNEYLSMTSFMMAFFWLGMLSNVEALSLARPYQHVSDWAPALGVAALVGVAWHVGRNIRKQWRLFFTAGLVGWAGVTSFFLAGAGYVYIRSWL